MGRARNVAMRLRGGAARPTPQRDYVPFGVGFHGDRYLIRVVESIAGDCQAFIETGTNVASTLAYMARNHPAMPCLSCEPDAQAYGHALKNTNGLENVCIRNEGSQEFLEFVRRERADLFERRCLFWLDAHSYGFQWPLKEEVAFITEHFRDGYILIDDMQVPGRDHFLYDKDNGQVCCFDFVRDQISPKAKHTLYYPTYTEKTSPHHPLKGWGAILFWRDAEVALDKGLMDIVARALV